MMERAEQGAGAARRRHLANLRAMALRFDAEAIRYRDYVADPGYGGNVNSEQMATDAADDADAIRWALRLIEPEIEVPRQTIDSVVTEAG